MANARFLFFVFSLYLFQGCDQARQFKETSIGFAADIVPTEAIETIDKQSWNQMKNRIEIFENTEAQSALQFLVDPLITAAQSQGAPILKWDIHVINDSELNAFALPGGTLGIHSGLIKHSESGLEVIGILAHEVAHVSEKHGVKAMMLQTGVSFATSSIVAFFFGDFGGISNWALGSIAQLGLLKFSRDNEREADALVS